MSYFNEKTESKFALLAALIAILAFASIPLWQNNLNSLRPQTHTVKKKKTAKKKKSFILLGVTLLRSSMKRKSNLNLDKSLVKLTSFVESILARVIFMMAMTSDLVKLDILPYMLCMQELSIVLNTPQV